MFDYVIVGGGSAGSVMAARLTENPNVTVCLLEAGGQGRDLLIRAPSGIIAMLPGRPKINNWAYQTEPQKHLNNRRGYQPRGRALGGSSAINAMLYVRGQPQDYDTWADMGCDGWDWDSVLPYFRKAEHNQRGLSDLHGADGPLQVSDQVTPRPISHAFVEAATECQYRRNDDFNGPEQEGVGLYQVTQFHDPARRGERCSAAAGYLHPVMNRPNLTVITGAQVTRVILEDGRAVGACYRAKRKMYEVKARHEVILCGGAFNSPQLLMLSGIGPADHLRDAGITVAHDLPGVGRNLQDHLDYVLAYKANTTDVLGIGLAGTVKLIREMLRWRKDGTGMIASPGAEGGAFLKSSPDLDRPDLQLHFVSAIVDDHARKLHLGYGYSCHVCVLRPKSRGRVTLASDDPFAAPRIDPNYLGHDDDAQLLLKGVKLTRRIMEAPSLSKFRVREIYTEGVADDDLMPHIRARADTVYHPVGTCRMGTDPLAVTDVAGRVHGMDGLRVVDASLMPALISGNTNAPTIMMAEKIAAEMATA